MLDRCSRCSLLKLVQRPLQLQTSRGLALVAWAPQPDSPPIGAAPSAARPAGQSDGRMAAGCRCAPDAGASTIAPPSARQRTGRSTVPFVSLVDESRSGYSLEKLTLTSHVFCEV